MWFQKHICCRLLHPWNSICFGSFRNYFNVRGFESKASILNLTCKVLWSFSTWVGSASPSCTIGAASFVHGGWSCYGCRLLEIWTCHPKTGFAWWLSESWCWMNSTQFRISFCKISRKTLIVGTQKISQVLPETKQIQFIMHHSMNAQERTDFDANQCDPFENC